MQTEVIYLIVFFVLSIGFSFLCSMLEAVLLSITPTFVQSEVSKKTRTGLLLSKFKNDIDRPLSAILTLNTIAHTVGAIGVGAMAGKIFGETELNLGLFHLSAEAVIATVMTLAILVLSEIIPKTLGANNWRAYAAPTASILNVMLVILRPFVWVSQRITKTLKKEKEESIFSRVAFTNMAKDGELTGALNQQESKIIHNVLTFERTKVTEIMTPKIVTFMVHEDTTFEEFNRLEKHDIFSRIPVYNESRDDVTGIILKDELLQRLADGHVHDTVQSIKRHVDFVTTQTTLLELFNIFSRERRHMAIVVDQFHAVQGVVTMEDLFEKLLGTEIMDESDEVADMQELARERIKERTQRLQSNNPTKD